jgi:hypothetical protein
METLCQVVILFRFAESVFFSYSHVKHCIHILEVATLVAVLWFFTFQTAQFVCENA